MVEATEAVTPAAETPTAPMAAEAMCVASATLKARISALKARMALPVFAAPMFLVSGPELVIAACKAGVVGTFPTHAPSKSWSAGFSKSTQSWRPARRPVVTPHRGRQTSSFTVAIRGRKQTWN
jgi:hypothetical protein